MKEDDIEFFDIVNEKDEVIGKISENMQIEYNNEITNYDQDGIEKLYYMTKEEIRALMNNKPDLFKTDCFVVMEYLFDKKYL